MEHKYQLSVKDMEKNESKWTKIIALGLIVGVGALGWMLIGNTLLSEYRFAFHR